MSSNRRNINKGVKLYNKILKEFTKINSTLPEDRKLSVSERRRYVSERLYPQYKGTPISRVGVKAIRVSVFQVIESVIPKEGCDVNYISPSVSSDIGWFDLDDFIRDVLPKCIFIRVDAGILGVTRIFNTLNYNYTRSGVRKIIENIREKVKNNSDGFFTGVKKLRKNKANDGTPENYFLDFILVVNSRPISPIEPIVFNVPKGEKRKITSVKNAILSRVKDLSNKKKRKVKARKNVIKNISDIKKKNKRLKRAKSPKFKQRLSYERLKDYIKAEKQIVTAYNRGNLTKEQYDKYIGEINRLIEEVKRNGGII